MDVMLENYLRRMEQHQLETNKLLQGITAELCLQRGIRCNQYSYTTPRDDQV